MTTSTSSAIPVLNRAPGDLYTPEGQTLFLDHEVLECELHDIYFSIMSDPLSTLQHDGVPFHIFNLKVAECASF